MISVNWAKIGASYISYDEMNNLIDSLRADKNLTEISWYHCRRFYSVYKTYCILATDSNVKVRIVYGVNNLKQYIFDVNDTSETRDEVITGLQAYNYVEDFFKQEYPSYSIFRAFSGVKYKEIYNDIKKCVPKQICMINSHTVGRIVRGIYKADVSSAYPYEATKDLPTLKDCIIEKGIKKPNKDYPFAFYINSHHLAIYNEFDTHDWKKDKMWYTLYDENFCDYVKNETTILCKKSEFTLKNVFEKIYNEKTKGNKIAKLGMNACIGFFQKNSDPKLSHLSAVIIARCCDRMLKLAQKLQESNNFVLFISTDSIAWKGEEVEYACNFKKLGSFTYEYKNVSFYSKGPKAYQILDNDGTVITKYAGMKNSKEKEELEFGGIPDLQGNRKYIIDIATGNIDVVDWGVGHGSKI